LPTYKDEKTNTWYCKFYYEDWTGERKQKLKRSFTRQKDSKEWERQFLEQQQGNPDMTFGSLTELYRQDMNTRLRESTMITKMNMIDTKILPYFKDVPINQLKPSDIRKWQNELLDKGFADTYLKVINNQLKAVLNYAVKYYGLRDNPCTKAGTIGKMTTRGIDFWTKDEFTEFFSNMNGKPTYKIAVNILYWSGIRIGELNALTMDDIDFENKTIKISKSYQRIHNRDVITEPKTPKSNRTVTVPQFLLNDITEYSKLIYGLKHNQRLFQVNKQCLKTEINKICDQCCIKKIRVHDLRHPYVKLKLKYISSKT